MDPELVSQIANAACESLEQRLNDRLTEIETRLNSGSDVETIRAELLCLNQTLNDTLSNQSAMIEDLTARLENMTITATALALSQSPEPEPEPQPQPTPEPEPVVVNVDDGPTRNAPLPEKPKPKFRIW